MLRMISIALLAGSGIMLAAAPAMSERPSGGVWSAAPKGDSKSKAKAEKDADKPAPAKADANGDDAVAKADLDANANANAEASANSQGAANANVRAVERANENSALARGSVASSALPGLTTGLNVKNSAGASVGTVSQVVTGTDGSIRLVIVTDSSGNTLRLLPDQLSIAGGVVTTTQANIGG